MTEKKEKATPKSLSVSLEAMDQAGLHFGHRTSRIHPKMKPYLQGVRNAVHIIDLEKTAQKLKETLKFIEDFIKSGKTLLLVGTKMQIKDLIKETAQECGLPYVNERWLGGTLTNFETILKRINYFQDLEKKYSEGEFKNYTKKEKAKIEQELVNLKTKFTGIQELKRVPDAIFVVDIEKDILAVKEAKKKNLKIIAITDTNVNPGLTDYFIPANDDAIPAVKYILERLAQVVKKAKAEADKKKVKTAKK